MKFIICKSLNDSNCYTATKRWCTHTHSHHTHGRPCIYVQSVNFNKNFSETNNFRDLISLNTDYYLWVTMTATLTHVLRRAVIDYSVLQQQTCVWFVVCCCLVGVELYKTHSSNLELCALPDIFFVLGKRKSSLCFNIYKYRNRMHSIFIKWKEKETKRVREKKVVAWRLCYVLLLLLLLLRCFCLIDRVSLQDGSWFGATRQ